jgi:hypothetical protein
MLTTSQASDKLKSIYKVRFRAQELNEFAQQLRLKENYIKFGCSKFYLWNETDFSRLKLLIEQQL